MTVRTTTASPGIRDVVTDAAEDLFDALALVQALMLAVQSTRCGVDVDNDNLINRDDVLLRLAQVADGRLRAGLTKLGKVA